MVLASYPRSGRTWLAFILGEVLTGTETTFGGKTHPIPSIERVRNAPRLLPRGGHLVRTHEPFRREYRKAIYLVRHVGDVIASYHHYLRLVGTDGYDMERFVSAFLDGEVDGYGTWVDHVDSWLDAPMDQRMVVRYEDLHGETELTVAKILDFLGVPTDPQTIADAVANNSFERMRMKESLRPDAHLFAEGERFVRRGAIGAARTELSESQWARVLLKCESPLARLGYLPTLGPIPAPYSRPV